MMTITPYSVCLDDDFTIKHNALLIAWNINSDMFCENILGNESL